MLKRSVIVGLGALLVVGGLARLASGGFMHADAWPTRPVTMIVPFAAGGPTDVVGRIVAQRLGEVLEQQIVVEMSAAPVA